MSQQITLQDSERTQCEIWSRVMGYHRPVAAYNAGKQQEHAERQMFRETHHGVIPTLAMCHARRVG